MDTFEEHLIEHVKKNEILYNKKSKGYKNTAIKADKWKTISINLRQSEKDCISRWKSLRDKFAREYKLMKNKPSGSGNVILPQWEYYDSLTFLIDHLQPRPTVGNFNSTSIWAPSDGDMSNSSSSSTTTGKILPVLPVVVDDEDMFDYIEEDEFLCDGNVNRSFSSSENKIKKDKKDDVSESLTNMLSTLSNYVGKLSDSNNFPARINVLINGLKPINKKKCEKKILEYLCKCQLEDLNDGDVDDVFMM